MASDVMAFALRAGAVPRGVFGALVKGLPGVELAGEGGHR
jgi:hypothetical protein